MYATNADVVRQAMVNEWLRQRIPEGDEKLFEIRDDRAVFRVKQWKWYEDYEEVKVLSSLFSEFAQTFCLDERDRDNSDYAVEFIRVGEDYEDIETWANGQSEYRLYVERTITVDG
jgi:hypothetical protein